MGKNRDGIVNGFADEDIWRRDKMSKRTKKS